MLRRRGLCKEPRCINFPDVLTWMLIVVFLVGMLVEIIQTLSKIFMNQSFFTRRWFGFFFCTFSFGIDFLCDREHLSGHW